MLLGHVDSTGKRLHQHIPFPLDILGAKYEYLMMRALGFLTDREFFYSNRFAFRFVDWLANSLVLPLAHGEVVTLDEVERLVTRLEGERCTIALGICECRHGERNETEEMEEGHDPNYTCVMIGDWGKGHLYSYPQYYRTVTAEELLEKTRFWYGRGRILNAWGVKDIHGFMISYCHCRPDYCVPLRNQTKRGNPVFLPGYSHAAIDRQKCLGPAACTFDCTKHCYFGAISEDGGRALLDAAACHGCGQCFTNCPAGAATRVPKNEHRLVYVPEDLVEPL